MCKARFNRRSTLWNHKRIHSDDKPFECNVCRMTFKWKNSLKCHKEMHQRKNEITGFENDPNEKTLTYATAAKKRMVSQMFPKSFMIQQLFVVTRWKKRFLKALLNI